MQFLVILREFCRLLFGNTDFTVKNSCEFAHFIRDKPLNACEELVSFDVVSLFTKILLDLAVKVAEDRLREDASLGQRTSLPVILLFMILFICCIFASTQRNLHTTAPTINRFPVQLWVRPSLLHCQHGNGRRGTKGLRHFTG